jgi:hypothetical protein
LSGGMGLNLFCLHLFSGVELHMQIVILHIDWS